MLEMQVRRESEQTSASYFVSGKKKKRKAFTPLSVALGFTFLTDFGLVVCLCAQISVCIESLRLLCYLGIDKMSHSHGV